MSTFRANIRSGRITRSATIETASDHNKLKQSDVFTGVILAISGKQQSVVGKEREFLVEIAASKDNLLYVA